MRTLQRIPIMDHTLKAKHLEPLSQILAASNIASSGSKGGHLVTPYRVLAAVASEMAKVKRDGRAEPPA
jgi:hypothetical protein